MRKTLSILLGTALMLMPAPHAQAHHGWAQFDTSRPYYLEGRVESIRWSNPHPSIVIAVPQPLTIPPWLSTVELPRAASWAGRMMPDLEIPEGLSPVPEIGREWTVILAPTTRLADWGMQRTDIAVGESIAVIGFVACDRNEHELRPEFIVLANKKVVRQRSVPLPATMCRR